MKILAIDCGSRNAWFHDGNTTETRPRETIINAHLDFGLERGDWIVIEDAHGGVAKTGASLSQVFTDDELVAWYSNLKHDGVELKLFPQDRTPHLKKEGDEKSDEADVKLLWEFAAENQGYEFKKPRLKRGYTARQQRGHEIKAKLNTILNIARVDLYDESVEPAEFVRCNIDEVYDMLPDSSRKILYPHTPKGVRSKASSGMESTVRRLSSLAAIFWAADGTPSWKFVKQHLLIMSPFHRKGGVLRSNIFWHGMTHYIRRQYKLKYGPKSKIPKDFRHDAQKLKEFKQWRKEYQNAIRDAYRVLTEVFNAVQSKGDRRELRAISEA